MSEKIDLTSLSFAIMINLRLLAGNIKEELDGIDAKLLTNEQLFSLDKISKAIQSIEYEAQLIKAHIAP